MCFSYSVSMGILARFPFSVGAPSEIRREPKKRVTAYSGLVVYLSSLVMAFMSSWIICPTF